MSPSRAHYRSDLRDNIRYTCSYAWHLLQSTSGVFQACLKAFKCQWREMTSLGVPSVETRSGVSHHRASVWWEPCPNDSSFVWQVRKLEFLLADAIRQGCDSVITFGGPQSNHVRATVLAARELGLQTHVMVLNPTPEEDIKLTCEGNLLLNRLAGAKLIVFPTRTDITRAEHLKIIHERMKDYAQKLRYDPVLC